MWCKVIHLRQGVANTPSHRSTRGLLWSRCPLPLLSSCCHLALYTFWSYSGGRLWRHGSVVGSVTGTCTLLWEEPPQSTGGQAERDVNHISQPLCNQKIELRQADVRTSAAICALQLSWALQRACSGILRPSPSFWRNLSWQGLRVDWGGTSMGPTTWTKSILWRRHILSRDLWPISIAFSSNRWAHPQSAHRREQRTGICQNKFSSRYF